MQVILSVGDSIFRNISQILSDFSETCVSETCFWVRLFIGSTFYELARKDGKVYKGASNPVVNKKSWTKGVLCWLWEEKERNIFVKWTENRTWLRNTEVGMICIWCSKHCLSIRNDLQSSQMKYKQFWNTRNQMCTLD